MTALALALNPALAAWAEPAAAADAPVAALAPPHSENLTLVLLEVRLDAHILGEAITTYQLGRETFLPLGELARLLTLAIRTQPEQGTAEGFILSQARDFGLNVAQSKVTLAGQTQAFDPALVRLQDDDIYVASALLAQWLPLDLVVNSYSLTLQVHARERLPLQERLERERLGARAGSRTAGYEDPGYPRQELPYRLLGMPFIDQTLGVGLRAGNGSRQGSASYTAYLTGDLLGMESALYVSSTQDKPAPELRFTLARHDPDAGLLGPLRARSVMFGSAVSMPSVANITGPGASVNSAGQSQSQGLGLSVSNRPIDQPTSFDRHTLQGELPPGWDVELYFNDALTGFQASRPDGRYRFEDQPLVYGLNEFRLVFHGPLGQQRLERQSFLLDQSGTPPGAFYYGLAQQRDGAGQPRSSAQFEWGLNKSLTATGGLTRLPALAAGGSGSGSGSGSSGNGIDSGIGSGGAQLYANLGLRAFWRSFILSSDFLRSPGGGWLNESGFKTRMGNLAVSYSRTRLQNFTSEAFLPSLDPLHTRDKLRLDGAIPATFLPRLPVTLEVQRDRFVSGRSSLALTGRVAAYVNATSVSNQLSWQTSGGGPTSGGATSANGALQLSHRAGGLGLSGQLGYSLKPQAKLDTIVLAGDKRLNAAYLLNLGLVRSLSSRETMVTAGLNKSLGRYGLGLSASYSNRGGVAVGVQLFIAMGQEPRQAKWKFDALPKADSGAASVRVFLDNNANGLMDSGEEALENVAMTVNGRRTPARTDAAGITWLDRLPVRQHVDIAVDAQTLEDPYWAPQRKGVRLVPRPGHVAQLDFPVMLTSEIDGTVYLQDKTGRRGMGSVLLELLGAQGQVVASTQSSSDGYYIVPAVPQGSYTLRVSPSQRQELGLIDPGTRPITIAPDGQFINGVDFVLGNLPAAAGATNSPAREFP